MSLQPMGMMRSAASSFQQIRFEFLRSFFRRQPTLATYLGIHEHDACLEDYSGEAVQDAVRASRDLRARLLTIPQGALSFHDEVDRQQLLLAVEAEEVKADVVRRWVTSPDLYSSGLTNSAYAMVKREFAPAEERLCCLIARLRAMPAVLEQARRNLANPPRVFTELAIQQLDGNRAFFQTSVPSAFASVPNAALQNDLAAANRDVIQALDSYKVWLEGDLLPRSNGAFALGAEGFRRRLWAEEMIDTPLDTLLEMAEKDFASNQKAFVDAARRIDPYRDASEVLAEVERHRPTAEQLFDTTQRELDALATFLSDRGLVTVPDSAPVRVKETPPFLRATTSASIEIPGPFEAVSTEAYYNLTLPDPRLSTAERDDFMRQWYYPAISNTSVHEVWPGHHLQFLHARRLASDVRKVLGVASNVEGWAHYAEQMVVDEGLHGDDPRYRLAQLQDALLRNARFIVGIRMHTQGLGIEAAERFFREEARQPAHVARLEARRGTFDATYGYYTLGKLMILELRDDYRHAMGGAYSLRGFHDAFMHAGPLPLRLAKKVIFREAGLR